MLSFCLMLIVTQIFQAIVWKHAATFSVLLIIFFWKQRKKIQNLLPKKAGKKLFSLE